MHIQGTVSPVGLMPVCRGKSILFATFATLAVSGAMGCMTRQQAAAMRTGQGEAMPVIDIRPGVAERLALMDDYRLHDETRKHMMRRPHVTVEELPLDEAPTEDAEEEPNTAADRSPPAGDR